MSLKDDAFPSSEAFDVLKSFLGGNDKDRKDAIKQGNGIYAFVLKNSAGKEQSWYIDLKETGTVAKGDVPAGKKADTTLLLSEENFGKLVNGGAKAQNLFMNGKLKVRGNVMKATKMEPILSRAGPAKAKL